MDEIHVHKTKKSICAHFAESPCISAIILTIFLFAIIFKNLRVSPRCQTVSHADEKSTKIAPTSYQRNVQHRLS